MEHFALIEAVRCIEPGARVRCHARSLSELGCWLITSGTINGQPLTTHQRLRLHEAGHERVARAWIDSGVLDAVEQILDNALKNAQKHHQEDGTGDPV